MATIRAMMTRGLVKGAMTSLNSSIFADDHCDRDSMDDGNPGRSKSKLSRVTSR